MFDENRRTHIAEEKAKTRKRIRVKIDPDNYDYVPGEEEPDFHNITKLPQKVFIYVRVSTDDPRQTTSFELQKKYYEDYVKNYPLWELVHIFADEGKSGTDIEHRPQFKTMIAEAKAGKCTLIITKSVSRFSRNILHCIGFVRQLAEMEKPVGVFFESEAIFSLKDDSQMALSFISSMADEESHTRARSMESSLRMRLDNGIPLTPKLLGYMHDEDGNLIINPEEAPTVKLVFYMYLYGYSTQQIADTLLALQRKSYLGNTEKWTATGVVQILRNERHCGEVITRKTYTPNFRDHKSKRNKGKKPQSHYYKHHEPIVSRDDFIAVQRMLNNAKYRNKSFLPELRVIESGILKGFVTINPRWAGFSVDDYFRACHSAYHTQEGENNTSPIESPEVKIELSAGDFDLRGFEITRSEFFDFFQRPTVTFQSKKISFSAECIKKFGQNNYVELLINPIERKFAVRSTTAENRHGVFISKLQNKKYSSRYIPATAFWDTLFSIFGWNSSCKYRIIGSLFETGDEFVYIFDSVNTEAFFQSYVLPGQEEDEDGSTTIQPFTPSGKLIRAIPEAWTDSFGKEYYLHEQTLAELANQSKEDWQLRMEGQLFETGKKINVTGFDELKSYISHELNGILPQES